MQDIQPFVDEIIGYANLEEDWDTYGARRISQVTIQNALQFLHEVDWLPYATYPVPDGSIQICFDGFVYELEVDVYENRLCEYLVCIDTPETLKFYDSGEDIPLEDMIDISKRWLHERSTDIIEKKNSTAV